MDPEQRKQLEQLLGLGAESSNVSTLDPNTMTVEEKRRESFNSIPADDPARYKQDDKYSEQIKAERGDPEMDAKILDLTKRILKNSSEDGSIPGSGLITNFFMDPEEGERGLFGKTANLLMSSVNQKANEVQADISDILAKQYQKAYETLKGGGQITVYEGRTVAAALTKLGQSGLTDETRMQELKRMEKILEHSTQRGALGIQTDAKGREYQVVDGVKKQVITAIDSNNQLKVIEVDDQDAVFIPNRLSDEQKDAFLKALQKGQVYVTQDENGNLQKGRK